ncbi:hypothetical protein MARINON1_51074 [Marinobacter salarius]|nr:hypothetical protein MBHK15_130538 [Marinobacter salarius]VXB69548.1 hypothetical protein MARINON1_51074 [Marinobacter salarius]
MRQALCGQVETDRSLIAGQWVDMANHEIRSQSDVSEFRCQAEDDRGQFPEALAVDIGLYRDVGGQSPHGLDVLQYGTLQLEAYLIRFFLPLLTDIVAVAGRAGCIKGNRDYNDQQQNAQP